MGLSSILLAVVMLSGLSPVTAAAVARADEIPFGGTYQGARSTVSISQPKPFTPSPYVTKKDGRSVEATVTVVNKGSDVMESWAFILTATCGGEAAPMIYDSAKDLNGMSPPGDILPGRSMTWRVGFWVSAEPCELIINSSFGSSTVYFVGKA